jgi:sugar/nucleoside kinase (ribokinase family)
MDVRFVDLVPGRPTMLSVCFQYPDGSGGNITTVDSAGALLAERDVDLAEPWLSADTIALAAPEVPLAVRAHLLRLAGERGALRVASLTRAEVHEARETGFLGLVDLLALNQEEAAALAGAPLLPDAPEPFLRRVADAVLGLQPGAQLVVTAGARGAFGFDGAAWTHSPALPLTVASTAGAGDAMLGGVVAGLAAGLPFATGARREHLAERPLESALDLGALVAAFKVTSPHTIPSDLSAPSLLAFAREHGLAFGGGLARLLPVEGVHGR